MKLERVALIFEIVGGIAIVLSLVFVGLQMRDSNRATRAATTQAALQSEIRNVVAYLDHADVLERMVTGDSLAEGVETRKAILLYHILMVDSNARYTQYQAGYLDEPSWQARRRILAGWTSLPTYEKWLEAFAGQGQSQEFLDLLEEIRQSSEEE